MHEGRRLAAALAALALTAGGAARGADESDFAPVYRVLTSPRCLNCHTATGFPRQGDERRRHDFGVVRGVADHGAAAMHCSTCHTDANQAQVPGAPHWGLAPLAMSWEDKTEAALCRQLTDRRRNGGRTPAMLFDHMAHDPLVGWGWAPGGTRAPVPMPKDEFVRTLKAWVDGGARCPQ